MATSRRRKPTTLFSHFVALDAALVAAGWVPTSPWWLSELTRFYSLARRVLVLRVGRRGGKSTTLCRVGVVEALYGSHKIPPGDIGVVAIISVSRDEASQRLRTIKAMLDVLGVAYKPIDGGIELVGRSIAFKVYTASLAGVSGFTCICAICDEVAKWRDADTNANPASEVLASLRPTMATQPAARMFLSSSPLGNLDAHATAFDQGETSFQSIAYAPSWEANPSLTEQATHDLEPDDRVWRREYSAIPQAGTSNAFDATAVDAAFALDVGDRIPSAPVMIVDASSGGADAFTWAVARWLQPAAGMAGSEPYKTKRVYNGVSRSWDVVLVRDAHGQPIPDPDYRPASASPKAILRFEAFGKVPGGYWSETAASVIVDRVVADARKHGCSVVYGDQRESLALSSMFTERGTKFVPLTWTNENKLAAVMRIRGWMRESRISVEHNPDLRRELLNFEEKITPAGAVTFGARGRAHDDHVALLVTAAVADSMGGLPASPNRRGPRILLNDEAIAMLGSAPRPKARRVAVVNMTTSKLSVSDEDPVAVRVFGNQRGSGRSAY